MATNGLQIAVAVLSAALNVIEPFPIARSALFGESLVLDSLFYN